jgi:hypothetical protein
MAEGHACLRPPTTLAQPKPHVISLFVPCSRSTHDMQLLILATGPPPEPRQKAIWGARSRWWARGCMRRMPSGIYMIASSAKDAPRCLPSAADRPEDVGGLHRLEYQDGASRTLTWAAVTEAALEQARRVPLPPTLISRWHAPCGGCADRGSSVSAQRPLRVVQRASGRMSPRADVGTALGAR